MRTAKETALHAAPFVRSRVTTGDLMYLVVLALLPCAGMGIYRYGLHAALLIGISVGTAVICEFVCDWIWKKRAASVLDYSCLVTGLIGGLILPPAAPLWTAAAESALAVILFKHAFGGLGHNLLNPAMAAKCVLLLLARNTMLNLTAASYDAVTPLLLLQSGETPNLWDMLTGNVPGCIGTSSAIAVMAAAALLYLMGLIDLWIPLASLISFSACYVLVGRYGLSPYTLAIQLCGGSFLFTAFVMAEDFTTSPVSHAARVWYGLIFGAAVFGLRKLGLYEDAAVYALLLVNFLRPFLDRKLVPKPFGATAKKWIIREPRKRRSQQEGQKAPGPEVTNELLDEQFLRFQEQIEKEARGLEAARYTGDDTLLREAYAEAQEERRESF